MRSRFILLPLALLFSVTARADLFEPFSTTNLNPFAQVYGVPAAAAFPARGVTLGMTSEVANNFTESRTAAEAISIDGETLRVRLSATWRLNDRWYVAAEVPWLRHSGGSMDQFIETWHNVFGLPGGGREDYPQDELQYAWADATGAAVNLRRTESGLGDVRLMAGYLLSESDHARWTVNAGMKLPTGDAGRLTGSESTDVFAGTQYYRQEFMGRASLHAHASLGLLVPGDGEVLEHRLEDQVIYGSATIAWQARERLSLKAQLDVNSPLFDSDLKELGDPAAVLVLGGSLALGQQTRLDIAVSEDILTDTAPDVAIQFRLQHTLSAN